MASTITLAGTIAATQPMLGYRPLTGFASGTIWEPAITMANLVKLAILSPPFDWRWNRAQTQVKFNCVIAQTDYPETVSNFGWIEWCSVNDLDSASPLWRPMGRVDGLAVGEETGLPRFIAPQYDNAAGQITFRVLPVPDAAYPVAMDTQLKPTLFAQSNPTSQFWGPIPDEYSHLYTWGFQALGLQLAGDPRFGEYNQKFVNSLLATHQGLSETQKSDFLNTWMATSGGQEVLIDKLKQGIQARGV